MNIINRAKQNPQHLTIGVFTKIEQNLSLWREVFTDLKLKFLAGMNGICLHGWT
jgi:hypothetical protein